LETATTHTFVSYFRRSKASSNGYIMKDVAKKIAMSVGAPVVIIYLLVAESFSATKKILKPARVHPIGV
jgi:DMSO/TMAO reductase YedYZ heme-binding membrane subunit